MKLIIKISHLLLNACFLKSFNNKYIKNKKTLLVPLLLISSIPLLLAQPPEFNFTPTNTSGSVIAIVQINGNPALGLNWIAAFDKDDNCSGAVQLVNLGGLVFFNLSVYGDDPTTSSIDEGINAGETFTFKLWVGATNEILENPLNIQPVTGWNAGLNGAPIPGYGLPDEVVINFVTTDADADGFLVADDPDDTDPCIPDNSVTACTNGLLGDCLSTQPDILWKKSYGGSDSEEANSIELTTDGGYVFAGYSMSNNGHVGGNYGYSDFWIVKLDESGNLQWEKNYGGSSSERANSIKQTVDGGYIVTGWTTSNNGDVSGNNGKQDCWIIKLDELGNLQWEKNYGTSGWDRGTSIQQTTDGGYIVAGEIDMDGNSHNGNYWILKLDELGNLQWGKNYGSTKNDFARSIEQTTDGGYIVAGETYSNDGDVSYSNGSVDFWIVKLNQLGDLEWEKSYGGSHADGAYSIQQTTDGGYICAGYTASNDGDVGGNNGKTDCWIIKLNELGNLEWEKNYGDLHDNQVQSIKQTTDGGYICASTAAVFGSFNYWIIKLDEVGNIQAEQKYGGSNGDIPHSIIQTTSGNYTVAGYTASTDGDICESFGSGGIFTTADAWILNLNSECFSTLEITENTPFQNLYTSCGAIATSGDLVVEQNQQVQYCANRTRLNVGFSVVAGAEYKVRVDECD